MIHKVRKNLKMIFIKIALKIKVKILKKNPVKYNKH